MTKRQQTTRKAKKKPQAKPAASAKPRANAANKRANAEKRAVQTSKAAATPPKAKSANVAKYQGQHAAPTSLFKFRRYKKKEGGKKVKHPKLIVEENETEYGFMGFTEDSKSGHHKNIKLTTNPKKGDTRPAYIRKELRYDITDNFYDVLENYNLSEKDKQAIIEYLNKHKKKK